jgi:alpha-beta hydrolase superfamily lysophospholipase
MQQQNILDASKEPFKLNLPDRIIYGALHLPGSKNPPCVITCHGLFSTMESDKFTAIADAFTKAGIAIIRFDFSGCGKSSGNISDTTISRRIEELEKVVDFSKNHPALGKKFGILGSSLGGYVSLFFASKNHVDALSVWATPYDLAETCNNIPENDLKILNQSFFDDASKYNLSSILTKIKNLQVIQGKKDLTVPWQHAEKIYNGANHPKKLIFFPEGDHSISETYDREKAVNESLNWILNRLINT